MSARGAVLHLLHICLRKTTINRLAFLINRIIDSVSLGRDRRLRSFAPNRAMLLVVHVHHDLVLTLSDGHRRLNLARRVTRWLASRLLRGLSLVVVALGG